MNNERWRDIEDLFRFAADLAPREQRVFLDTRCANDSVLRAELESLLTSDRIAGRFIEDAVDEAASLLICEDAELEHTGQWLIGSYRIQREIGRGGVSIVYLAARADEQYESNVAVKLIRRGMDSRDLVRRFRIERQILADLNHPNIARLLDGGTTEHGLPYVVMEYVDGLPITEYCDALKLTITQRLKLFRTVCSAVQYAHQNLIVHRDLKPSNILVGIDGTPKLLDFGIAKLLEPSTFETAESTSTESRMMTPGYASPEHVRGVTITTASDVYSLGVLLYEMLSGHRPYSVEGRTPQETERIICEIEPEPPSRVVTKPERPADASAITTDSITRSRATQLNQLRRRLTGDLDNITLMALRKRPERRYVTVADLSDDIRRHLERLPVRARKATAGYRIAKWVRRNRTAFTAATIIVVLLVAMSVTSRIQSIHTAHERDKAEKVSQFLVSLFEVSDPGESRGNSIRAREILDRGAAKISQELKDEPDVQAALMDTLGRVYFNLGLYDNSEPLLESALAIKRRQVDDNDLSAAATLTNLADLLQMQGRYDRAEQLYREALEMRRRLLPAQHALVAQSLHDLADLLHDKGEYETAEPICRAALDMRIKVFGPEHPDVADSLNNLGLLLHDKARYDEAEPLYRQSLEMRRRCLGAEHPKVAESLNNLGSLLRAKGDLTQAEPLLREALEIDRKVFGNVHPNVSGALSNLASLLQAKGAHDEAETCLLEAVAINRSLFPGDHPDVATSLHELARVYDSKGDYARAESLYRHALEMYRKTLPAGHAYIAHPLVALGKILNQRGDYRASEPLLREALEIRKAAFSEDHWRTAEAASLLGECLASTGRYAEAESMLLKSRDVLESALGEHDWRYQDTLKRLIKLYERWGNATAAASYRESLSSVSSKHLQK
jgi:eukaryotic-like serine/threonine-protein kinase